MTLPIPKRSPESIRSAFLAPLPVTKETRKFAKEILASELFRKTESGDYQFTTFKATVLGELASKSNQRQIVMIGGFWIWHQGKKYKVGGRPMVIKSAKARAYVKGFLLQTASLPKPAWLQEGEMVLEANIFYASQRPDLDCALLQDCIQEAGIIKNDRQFRKLVILHFIDKLNPRIEFKIYPRTK